MTTPIEVCKIKMEKHENNKKFPTTGQNPAVVTDATCYMGWIAEQYGLRLPRDYKVKPSCTQHTGDVNDVNKRLCR